MQLRIHLSLLFLLAGMTALAATGKWHSVALDADVTYNTADASKAFKDASGKYATIVYLENLGFEKVGQNTNAEDVAWLLSQGYRVIELDYGRSAKAVSPTLNLDIQAINSALQSGTFCAMSNCSAHRSYVLMEGYRIKRDVPYYLDDPTVYNYPDAYAASKGDSLYMDIVYPANPRVPVATLLTFSYANSHSTNKHGRMYLPYTFGQFKDSFVEGVPAIGMAWAVADHPKYCDWGQGKYKGGANKSLGSIEVNPDAVRKVKAAIRTLRGVGKGLGLGQNVAVTGFSRGSTAASLAVGDKYVADFEANERGGYSDESSSIQAAVLGPGVFDYAQMPTTSREYTNTKGWVTANPSAGWDVQSAINLIQTKASAPTLFYYNDDDEAYYATQSSAMQKKLKEVGVDYELIKNHGKGHSVPQKVEDLAKMYDFLLKYAVGQESGLPFATTAFETHATSPRFNLYGKKIADRQTNKDLFVCEGKIHVVQ